MVFQNTTKANDKVLPDSWRTLHMQLDLILNG